ncbi:MAG: hypothetical protein IIB05_05880 [Bacteroidetes bacterium]|nr:hypothetical protein [Bacteroidota bacterium]
MIQGKPALLYYIPCSLQKHGQGEMTVKKTRASDRLSSFRFSLIIFV